MAFYRPGDPRWNRTIQHITENLEHANESAQENIYSFTQRYIDPCLSSITRCANICTAPCFPARNDRRRHRARARGREEPSFDFYDDWDDSEEDGLLGWGSDSVDRIFSSAGSYGTISQPARHRTMSYAPRNRDARYDTVRRKSTVLSREAATDPTIIPTSSYFGFLDSLPFRIGGRGLRYKPSAAGLTEQPARLRRDEEEAEPLTENSDESTQSGDERKKHRRQRSDTRTSAHTADSLSSRSDIFPSEDEFDDAVPLDDEFAISLERRATAQWSDDGTSSKARSSRSKRPNASRTSTRTVSSQSAKELPGEEGGEGQVLQHPTSSIAEAFPTFGDPQKDEILRVEEEAGVLGKRTQAPHLTLKRRLMLTSQPAVESPTSPASHLTTTGHSAISPPLLPSPVEETSPSLAAKAIPGFADPSNMTNDTSSSSATHSNSPSASPSLHKSTAIKDQSEEEEDDDHAHNNGDAFIPARLPHFGPA